MSGEILISAANHDVRMSVTPDVPNNDKPRTVSCVFKNVPLAPGFQFKCFAKCDDAKNLPELERMLQQHFRYETRELQGLTGADSYRHNGYDLPLVGIGSSTPDVLWFIIPGRFRIEVSTDAAPFINNYFDKETNPK